MIYLIHKYKTECNDNNICNEQYKNYLIYIYISVFIFTIFMIIRFIDFYYSFKIAKLIWFN